MQRSRVKEDGTIAIPAFELPLSGLLDERTRAVLLQEEKLMEQTRDLAPPGSDLEAVRAQRAFFEENYYPPRIRKLRARYDVDIQAQTFAGVQAELITPRVATASGADGRVLINLHGGAFLVGGRYGGQLESIPIAALGKIKVVSIDYRMAPEHQFPAATEDVIAVYRELLEQHEPGNIGIYGCSAGAVLTAQTVASLQNQGLPPPGAVGMFFAAGSFWGEGDSVHIGKCTTDQVLSDVRENPYFKDADAADPQVFPAHFDQVVARFPPSLLLSATRDYALSSVVHMHSRLVALGVDASLHVWEGLRHAFFYDSDLLQSREAYNAVARFFARHLNRPA